ncbi:MAG TPA: ubiquinone/menaquinone biosynthesis methyltransferase [Candidatus Omnitrophota bacterium]|nr:MAG: Demethylmenaquinone methyltransferase [Candidatus Omnitrophica bacterium ADurb.Bin314]HOE68431.1 ubiquinone/menaquinone biosynthesis methyltransferase [Candidatus Omnitrophota bacterium]HQB93737.1 ubiquinone/menaquinone biosynthesis methyltransferase [Candidatus Omnitrophota bacterium]
MTAPAYTPPDKLFLRSAFDAISPRYDLLNQILSFGMSEAWRERSADLILKEPGFYPKTILDLGCGTGKFLECFLRRRAWGQAVGMDLSPEMLKRAREAVAGNVIWLEKDFDNLPFLDGSFDLMISGFTLRSVRDLPAFLREVFRVLSPGGMAAFLDLTRPGKGISKWLFYPYLRWVLPVVGWLISGNRQAYRFLSSSVRTFQTPAKTAEAMKNARFRDIRAQVFAFGAATLVIGKK